MSKYSDAIAVLRIGGSFMDAMALTGLGFEEIKQIWEKANETDRFSIAGDDAISEGDDGRAGID